MQVTSRAAGQEPLLPDDTSASVGSIRRREGAEITRAASGAFLLKLAGLAAGYVFALAVTRGFGAAVWGTFSLCFTVLTLGSIGARLGVDTAVLRFVAANAPRGRSGVDPVVRRGLLIVSLGAMGAGGLLWWLAPVVAELVFSKPHMTPALRVAALGVPPLAVSLLSSQALRGLKRVRQYVFYDLVARFLVATALLPVASRVVQADLAPLAAFVGGSYLVAVANLASLRGALRKLALGVEEVAAPSVRGLLVIGAPLLLASSATYLKGWVDTLMLGMYRTELEVGVYAVALKLATLASFPLVAVNTIAAPKFAEAFARGDTRRLRMLVEQASRMILLVSVPVWVLLVAGRTVWLGMFGADALAGKTVLVLLTTGFLVSALSGSVGYLLQMTGRQVAYQNITLTVLGLSVLLNALLIPRYGILGAGLSTCAGVLLFNGACVLYVRSRLGIWTLPWLGRADDGA